MWYFNTSSRLRLIELKAASAPRKKHAGGRPSKYAPELCRRAIDLGRQGKSRTQIAAALDVDRDTLTNWERARPEFFGAMLRARELAQAWWEDEGQKGIWDRQFNANAYRLQVTNRFPNEWRDKQSHEHSGADGARLIPEQDNRELAKAVVGILAAAKMRPGG